MKKKFLFINLLIILIMILFHIIILSCGPYNYKFYKFLKLYLSNATVFHNEHNNFSSDYKSYFEYYQQNSEK